MEAERIDELLTRVEEAMEWSSFFERMTGGREPAAQVLDVGFALGVVAWDESLSRDEVDELVMARHDRLAQNRKEAWARQLVRDAYTPN